MTHLLIAAGAAAFAIANAHHNTADAVLIYVGAIASLYEIEGVIRRWFGDKDDNDQ